MARSLLVGAEIACPTNAGAATSFGAATVVRLVNTDSSAHKITILEEQSGSGIGSMTLPPNSVCLLYTSPSPRDYAASRMPSSA